MAGRKPLTVMFLVLVALAALGVRKARGQGQPQPNRLVSGKLVYVAPMPDNLDQWIMEDLSIWGKYRVTRNPEGVDLVIQAHVPEKQLRYREREGVPHPKKEPKDKPPATSIDAVDWVSGQRVWSASILDKKLDHNEPEPAPGPEIEIRARGLKPDQLALKIVTELRRYAEQLEGSEGH